MNKASLHLGRAGRRLPRRRGRFRRADLRDRTRPSLASPCTSAAWASCFGGWTPPPLRSPQHPQSDQRPGGLQKNFADLAKEALGARADGKPVEIWFQDEARVGQQGTLTELGQARYRRARCATGASTGNCSARCAGRGVGRLATTVNIEAMNKHLIEIGKCVSAGAIALLIMDGAGWHSSPKLAVPENIVLLKLPPYAPELKPRKHLGIPSRQHLKPSSLGNLRRHRRRML